MQPKPKIRLYIQLGLVISMLKDTRSFEKARRHVAPVAGG